MRKYLTKYLISVMLNHYVVIARSVGMTFPNDKLVSDYQADGGITLAGSCIITLTKTHALNDNFTVACVKYYENTSIFFV